MQKVTASEPEAECEVSVIGVAFNDLNEDGNQGDGEAGQEGIAVNLYEDADTDNVFTGADSLVASRATDSQGNFVFRVSASSSYFVEVVFDQDLQPTSEAFRHVISYPCEPHVNLPLEFGFVVNGMTETLWFPCLMES